MRPEYFSGEVMHCILCGRKQKSDPLVNQNWRCLVAEGVPFYVCPAEFPPDSSYGSGVKAFEEAYVRVFDKILQIRAEAARLAQF